MSTAVLAIGSNVGDSIAHLRSVVAALGDRLVASSSVYRTAPWGGVLQQPFYNAVLLAAENSWEPGEWLAFAQECERAAQRTREVHWGPRTLDVDVIAVYDDSGLPLTQDDPALTVPHPHAFERAFVLAPWAELQPDAVLPQGPIIDLLGVVRAGGAADQHTERLDEVALSSRSCAAHPKQAYP